MITNNFYHKQISIDPLGRAASSALPEVSTHALRPHLGQPDAIADYANRPLYISRDYTTSRRGATGTASYLLAYAVSNYDY